MAPTAIATAQPAVAFRSSAIRLVQRPRDRPPSTSAFSLWSTDSEDSQDSRGSQDSQDSALSHSPQSPRASCSSLASADATPVGERVNPLAMNPPVLSTARDANRDSCEHRTANRSSDHGASHDFPSNRHSHHGQPSYNDGDQDRENDSDSRHSVHATADAATKRSRRRAMSHGLYFYYRPADFDGFDPGLNAAAAAGYFADRPATSPSECDATPRALPEVAPAGAADGSPRPRPPQPAADADYFKRGVWKRKGIVFANEQETQRVIEKDCFRLTA